MIRIYEIVNTLSNSRFIGVIWNSRIAFFVMGALSSLAALSFAISLGTNDGDVFTWISNFTQNFSTEMIGAVLTFGLFGIADRTKTAREYQQTLIRNARSPVNITAIQAIQELREHGWLSGQNSVLQKAKLGSANLEHADLRQANLAKTNLAEANLKGALLAGANLSGTDLWEANLTGADLWGANLTQAELWYTNLTKADLRDANLSEATIASANLPEANLAGANLQRATLSNSNLTEANLAGANLSNADIRNAIFDDVMWLSEMGDTAILPDGTLWKNDTDISRFTNEDHPDFWHSPQGE